MWRMSQIEREAGDQSRDALGPVKRLRLSQRGVEIKALSKEQVRRSTREVQRVRQSGREGKRREGMGMMMGRVGAEGVEWKGSVVTHQCHRRPVCQAGRTVPSSLECNAIGKVCLWDVSTKALYFIKELRMQGPTLASHVRGNAVAVD
jgi:hypothetical protein